MTRLPIKDEPGSRGRCTGYEEARPMLLAEGKTWTVALVCGLSPFSQAAPT